MKHCPKCEQDKPESEFSSRRKGQLSSYCKKCQRAYCRKHYKANKSKHNQSRYERTKKTRGEHSARIKAIKDNKPCTDCGVKYPHYILEFDHLDDKIANVADMPGKFGWDKIQKEMNKCDLICSNCHKKRTYERKMAERSVA